MTLPVEHVEFIKQDFSKNKPPKSTNKVDQNQFLKIESPYIAYILGLIWADGYVHKKYNFIAFTTTFPDANYFIQIFNKTGDWNISSRQPKNKNWKKSCRISTSNYFIANLLKNNDYCSKNASPSKILNLIPDSLKHYWFLGFLDGDGHICFIKGNKYSIHFCGPLDQDWAFLITLCNKLNIQYTTRKQKTKHGTASYFNIHGIKKSVFFLDYLYQSQPNSRLGLPRKHGTYLKMKKQSQIERYKYSGVCYDKAAKKWRATTKSPQKEIGRYPTKEEALLAVKQYYCDVS